jgi:hypothetical protein
VLAKLITWVRTSSTFAMAGLPSSIPMGQRESHPPFDMLPAVAAPVVLTGLEPLLLLRRSVVPQGVDSGSSLVSVRAFNVIVAVIG